MKKIIYLLTLLIFAGNGFAQKSKREVIYLKNGSVLKGQQTRVDNEKIVVRSGKNLWVIKESEIDTVTGSWIPGIYEDTGDSYFFKATIGLLAGSPNSAKPSPFSFDTSVNIRVQPNWYAGVGLGIDFLEESYLPVFGNLEYHFRESHFTPFLGLKAGYMIPLDDGFYSNSGIYYDMMPWSSYYYSQDFESAKGGVMINPTFGFVSQLSPDLGLMLSFGYRFHKNQFKGEDEYELEREYNRLTIRLGILFN